MKILFDLISTQKWVNGGAEYTIKIFNSLLQQVINTENEIIALYDTRLEIVYEQMSPDFIKNEFNVSCVDIAKSSISKIIQKHNIDVFFIGIGQRMNPYCLDNIDCRVICVIHDLIQKETEDIKLHQFLKINSGCKMSKDLFRKIKKTIFSKKTELYSNVMKFVEKSNVQIVTVSDYSKYSLLYYYESLNKEIKVLYSPEKKSTIKNHVENQYLKNIIHHKKKYFILLSADRELKNANIVLSVFKNFSITNSDFYILTIGYTSALFDNHLILPYLSDSDLEYALMNSYAMIYPSLYEGFGYPPLEAMKYSKPVLSSNVCSMPEVLGSAPLYFSPIYKADIFKALHKVILDYNQLSIKSKEQYVKTNDMQNKALDQMIDLILT